MQKMKRKTLLTKNNAYQQVWYLRLEKDPCVLVNYVQKATNNHRRRRKGVAFLVIAEGRYKRIVVLWKVVAPCVVSEHFDRNYETRMEILL